MFILFLDNMVAKKKDAGGKKKKGGKKDNTVEQPVKQNAVNNEDGLKKKLGGIYAESGLIRTIGDDEDVDFLPSSDEEGDETGVEETLKIDPIVAKRSKTHAPEVSNEISFADLETSAETMSGKLHTSERWKEGVNASSKTVRTASLEEQIRRARVALAAARSSKDIPVDEAEERELLRDDKIMSDMGDVVKVKRKRRKNKDQGTVKAENETDKEDEENSEVFEVVNAKKLAQDGPSFFSEMNLSRPLLRVILDQLIFLNFL